MIDKYIKVQVDDRLLGSFGGGYCGEEEEQRRLENVAREIKRHIPDAKYVTIEE